MATVVTLADQGRTQATVDAERARASEIKAGDRLTVSDLWNRTERLKSRQIPSPAVVAIVRPSRSQTGIMVTVASKTGAPISVDAGWFLEVQRAGMDAR